MTESKICTCPSGNGSLRHPCPAHPAPVEQAGGDERDLQGAQGGRDGWGPFPIVQVPWNVFDRAVMWVEDRRRYGDDGTIVDDWKALKTIQRAALAQPSPAQAEQAEVERPEVERPEVVAWQYRVTAGPQTGWSLWHPGKGEEFERSYTVERRPLMTVAQHERITAQLHDALDECDGGRWKLRSERDAALARVEELDKQCRDDVARALGLRPSQERGFAWSYLLASIKSCVKASEDAAQAQHSVPEGWKLVPSDKGCVTSSMKAECIGEFSFYIRAACAECLDAGTDSDCHVCGGDIEYDQKIDVPWDTCKEIYKAMLAAAPGKEGV
ncbi:hypothetical protein HKT22_01090 [Pseudomonas aeruginosa]|nr:hypothetical protein [Pseudomonas aeruginosa]